VSPNPSSIHDAGVLAKNKLEGARAVAASALGAHKDEIIFTSGATESNNLAIQGVVLASSLFPHIITTNIEHPSVLETFKLLEKRKLAEISIVPVEENGIVDPKKIKKEIKENTVLVSVMYANNEIGTIQPIKEIAKEIRHHNKTNNKRILFHIDAVQAVNYLDLNVERLGVDLLSISGAKIENSGRVGILYKKRNVEISNVFGGGDQEMGLRPGTENLQEIIKFSKALKKAQDIKEKENKRLTKLRDYFIQKIFKKFSEFSVLVNGDLENRLPNNINITFPKIPSDLLVIELSAKGVMISSKSACKSSKAEGSYVIKAIRHEADPEIGGLRFSLGRDTKKGDIDYTIKTLSAILQKLKKWYY
jgi:cysteine desulfurase